MLKHKRKLGLIIGIVTAVIIANGNFDGLSAEGSGLNPLVPALLV
ncbi:hypothetical protein [Halanaerobium sp. MA284_MarDTE_T2]|nr:hypothetical protein [Halanaerobium sp. MA284_MarDTE_T2]RCW44398.1 hypothetical protein DFR78_12019 [Halanaerobium sp. MA284_MarDTE_T2]